MAERIHRTYECDRCKADLGSTRPQHDQKTEVAATFNWTSGPGPHYVWRDLCTTCRTDVIGFFCNEVPSDGSTRIHLLTKLVKDCIGDLAAYLPPDSGISANDVVSTLLGRLDGPQARKALGGSNAR